ncbi:hypothetical protein, partial [Okeania sp. SIO2C9]|uniref:hypothetical protein n=1 Tax=Okeania sp. SIO2C9 TaxID=2607791 RepID=UPI0025D43490
YHLLDSVSIALQLLLGFPSHDLPIKILGFILAHSESVAVNIIDGSLESIPQVPNTNPMNHQPSTMNYEP